MLIDAALYPGLEKVRSQLPSVDVIFLASDMKEPALYEGLNALRNEFRFAATPVVIVAKPGEMTAVRNLVRADYRLGEVTPGASPADVSKAIAVVSQAVGAKTITADIGTQLAMEATRGDA